MSSFPTEGFGAGFRFNKSKGTGKIQAENGKKKKAVTLTSKLYKPLLLLGLECWARSEAPGYPTGSENTGSNPPVRAQRAWHNKKDHLPDR